MKTILYYFSGTGNTLMLARLLAKELDGAEIINIVSCENPVETPEADVVGILFPVYAFGLPKIMRDFVKNKLQIADNTYVFSLSNFAGAGAAAASKQLRNLLLTKRTKLNARFWVPMPSNYIPFGGAESQKKQNKRFLSAADRISKIVKIIDKRPENYFYKRNRIPLFIAKICNNLFMKSCGKDAKKFYADDKCSGDGICARVCPTNNIKMVEGFPVWGSNCEQCMACLQWCTHGSIHIRGVPEDWVRYHNPGFEAEDLIKDMKR